MIFRVTSPAPCPTTDPISSRIPRPTTKQTNSAIRYLTRALPALALLVFVFAPGLASAHGYKLDEISVGHVWAQPPKEGDAGIDVYGPVVNGGDKVLEIVGASSPDADHAGFRTRAGADGKAADKIVIQPGKPYGMAAWRTHIYLSGVHKFFKTGDWIPVTLKFGDGRELTVKVLVAPNGEEIGDDGDND